MAQVVAVLLGPVVGEGLVGGEGDQALPDPEEPDAAFGIPADYDLEAEQVLPDEGADLLCVREAREPERAVRCRRQRQVLGRVSVPDHAQKIHRAGPSRRVPTPRSAPSASMGSSMDAATSSGLFQDAADVLRRNDMGGWTRAAPNLYPHQWSWDVGFIAIGLAHLDTRRAAEELRGLFRYQWKNGKVPHIVFNPHAPPDSYFPGPEHWVSAGLFPDAPPAPPYTSALCQPPTHAIGALKVFETARRQDRETASAFLREIYPRLLSWHRYLATARDPEGSGLVTIYHPWESGTDNSPRWDAPLAAVEVGEMPPYRRRDLGHVDDPSERPTDEEYARYIWLVQKIKEARCDETRVYGTHPFLVKDVLFSAILVAANEALLRIGGIVRV